MGVYPIQRNCLFDYRRNWYDIILIKIRKKVVIGLIESYTKVNIYDYEQYEYVWIKRSLDYDRQCKHRFMKIFSIENDNFKLAAILWSMKVKFSFTAVLNSVI